MSSKSIQDSVRKLANISNVSTLACKVESVNINDKTCYCIPINGDADIPNVRIMAQNEKGFLLVPKVGSVVIISFLTDSDAYISMVSEVSEIQLNGDNYDGLVKINDLVTKLNNAENRINLIVTDLQAISIAAAATTTAPVLGSTLAGFINSAIANLAVPLTPTIKIDLENNTVKHGNGS
jgi:hypothetical protein